MIDGTGNRCKFERKREGKYDNSEKGEEQTAEFSTPKKNTIAPASMKYTCNSLASPNDHTIYVCPISITTRRVMAPTCSPIGAGE